MKTPPFAAVLTLGLSLLLNHPARADELASGNSKYKVPLAVPLKVQAFPLTDVRLLAGPFQHAMELDERYLLSLDTDRLLHNFFVNAGLPSYAQPLGGWEDPKGELRGHFVGHYLSACAQMYAATGDERFKQKGDAVVFGFALCQAKLRTGYLSAYPEEFIDRVEKRVNVWAPYYTLHKILAGLLDMHVYCDNPQALDTAKKFGDWVIARNSRLTDAQMQAMLETEHGGMNESLAELYALTGEEKYLKISLRFNHHAVMDPAAAGQDKLTGLHANTQIPKFIGNARQYELTGDAAAHSASLFFWNTVVKERSYVIGGHSDDEGFTDKAKLSTAFGPSTTETCNTYNMLKLTRHLFCLDPQAEYADFYERALLNHILASQNPETGMMCYYVPLRTGSKKNYNAPATDFWCCTGTGVENHGKYGDSIYFHDAANTLYVNLFIASELNWKEKGLRLRQETQYPDQRATRLVFNCDKPVELTLQVRHPAWAVSGFDLRVNGEKQPAPGQPGTYMTLARNWKTGDVIEITMPFTLRTEGFKDNTNRFAFLYGPLVLGAEVDVKKPNPAIVAEPAPMLASLKPLAGRPNTFSTLPAVFRVPDEKDAATPVTLEPFYKIYDRAYEVYWDRFTPAQWTVKEQAYAADIARRKDWEARSVDFVNPGEEQNERDHHQQGDKTSTGDFGDRKYRHAEAGGWFSWDLKVQPGEAQDLLVTYWGDDRDRRFDIWVDGKKLANERLQANRPGVFYDQAYPLSPDLTRDKQKVTVKIQGTETTVGGVFGVRIMKPVAGK